MFPNNFIHCGVYPMILHNLGVENTIVRRKTLPVASSEARPGIPLIKSLTS